MKAIAVTPGTTTVRLIDRPEPAITEADQIKVRVLSVGICGTDREEVAGGRARSPNGQAELIIGHEMFGKVVVVGENVARLQPGDYCVFTVRRGCGHCLPCAMNRPDMCRTGDYRERGIWGLDGYQAEYVVEKEQYAVRVPPELAPIGVLTEPISIAEKAIHEAVQLQSSRLPDAPASPDWLFNRRCLVVGLGAIGLVAAMILRLRGAEVYGLAMADASSARPQWLNGIGGHYVDGRQVPPERIDKVLGPMDLVFEAAGVPGLAFNILDALASNGVYVLTGIPSESRSLEIPGAQLIRQLVLDNQVMVGSVNAARDHFQMAVTDLSYAQLIWGEHVAKLITHRYFYADFAAALAARQPDEIKTVIEWADG
ncbi:MAG: glucose 1-dehydrogenase [Chloroflexi bacterium]|nr:glucose 1-dehydrogenase [Chloroflexota bacterium]